MRSIFLDYYIGSLLLWRGTRENFDRLSCEPLYGQPAAASEHIVLDGQQRLTAIGYAFLAPDVRLKSRAQRALYFIRIDRFAAREDDAFDFIYTAPGRGSGPEGAERSHGPRERQYAEHIFPLSLMSASGGQLYRWLEGYKTFWKERAGAAHEAERSSALMHVNNGSFFEREIEDTLNKFQVSFVELDRDIDLEKVCEIFTQINSRGVRLDIFDLINALLTPKGVELKELWRTAAPRLEFIDSSKMNVYVLQTMSIGLQSYSSPKYLYHLIPGERRRTKGSDGAIDEQVLIPTADDFVARWRQAVDALVRAAELLSHPHEFGVTKSSYLPYFSILPVFAATLDEARSQPPAGRLAANARFRLWYWASVFTSRYSASSETTAARDIQDLRTWFSDSQAEPPVVQRFRESVDQLDLRTEIKKGSAVYNGVFNLLVMAGAKDWSFGSVPSADELDDHHIVPKSWGARHLQSDAIDSILNRTPLSGETNRRVVRDRLPNAYLPELIETNGRETVEALMATHLISPSALNILLRDPFGAADFEAFLVERRATVSAAVRKLAMGFEAEPPADLRALDAHIEAVEIALRALISDRLEHDIGRLPQHVRVKVDERLARERRRHPGVDAEAYGSLEGALSFADLTELRGVMQSSGAASLFSDVFPHKEGLIVKFEQLGELRNAIRHTRWVNDVVRKEGEAAILWFQAALRSPPQNAAPSPAVVSAGSLAR